MVMAVAGGGGFSYTTTSGAGGSGFGATTGTINSVAVTAVSAGATTATVGITMNSTGTSDPNYPGGNIGNEMQDGSIFISYAPPANNMTLLSNTQTAQADPAEGRLMLYEEDVDSVTLDIDLKGWVSRDGGTTYTQTPLVEDTVYGQFGIDENTKLLLHMDGSNGGTTFTDSSGLAHIATAVGNAHTDTAVKKFGTASYQGDGTGDYLTIPASDDWDFGTGDFTVDAWVYASSANTYGFGQYAGGGAYAINQGGGTEVNWYRNGGSALNFGSSSSPTANTWTHVAIVRSSGTTTYYKDGVVTGSAQSDTFDYDGSAQIYYVGSVDANAGHPPLNGYIDEFRISKGVARWTAAFTPPTHAYGANQRILSGSVDISGQPAGSNMKYKVTTHNSKSLKLHGASLLWA